MSRRMLNVSVGRLAREMIAERGWDPELFSLLIGASGGPKWLVLSQMDRLWFGDFLQRRETPLPILGTSIGSWRHACLAQEQPVAAIARMEEAYIHQEYQVKPTPEEVSSVSRAILQHTLGETGVQEIVNNSKFRTHIGTVRGRGVLASRNVALHATGLACAALSNWFSRSLLQGYYQRVLFFCGPGNTTGMKYTDFSTAEVALRPNNLMDALLASASIPLTLDGVVSPQGAPRGTYWDGGVVDYHHDLRAYQGGGLILYPHFYPYVIPGWLDKSLKRRRARGSMLDRVVLLSPSPAFVQTLPGSKIPDRNDFKNLTTQERIERWRQVVSRCHVLAEELNEVLQQSDPLCGVSSVES